MKNIPPVRKRMKEFLKRIGISEGAFEEKIGMSTGWVSNIGDNIRATTLSKIKDLYSDINGVWLLTGEGEMFLTDHKVENKMIQQPTEGYIPVYDVTFALGFTPTFIDSLNNPEILGYVNFPELRGSTYVVKAKGNSMAPLINDRDFVGIRPVKNKNTIDYGNPYGIITEDLAVFKTINPSKDKNKIELASENEKHASFEITKEEVVHLFSVIGILSVKSITY